MLKHSSRHTGDGASLLHAGMYLTDLTFLEEGMPNFVNGMVNFVKRQRVSAVIREIQQFQQAPYLLQVRGTELLISIALAACRDEHEHE